MGGVNCPPVEATASTAAAKSALYPTFFINGIVIVPVVATLAMALPLIIPKRALANTATFAGPPVERPTSVSAISFMNWLNPLYFK